MIEFKNVCKAYDTTSPGQVEALKDVSLTIQDGEFVYVIGPNGSGKSTLVKLLTAEERITSGSLTFGKYDLGKIRRRQIPYLRRDIGMVYQDFRLIDTMTVYQNVAFAMYVVNAPAKEIRKVVPKVLDRMGLASKAKCYPRELSGGEQQRVGIARALVGRPKLIIADEPTGNVDPEKSYEILELLGRINEIGTTVILVTHQREFLRTMPRRVIMLEEGKVRFDEDLTLAAMASGQGAASVDLPEEEPQPEHVSTHVDEGTREFNRPDCDDGFVPPEN